MLAADLYVSIVQCWCYDEVVVCNALQVTNAVVLIAITKGCLTVVSPQVLDIMERPCWRKDTEW